MGGTFDPIKIYKMDEEKHRYLYLDDMGVDEEYIEVNDKLNDRLQNGVFINAVLVVFFAAMIVAIWKMCKYIWQKKDVVFGDESINETHALLELSTRNRC